MIAAGIILLILGVLGSARGPIDREYVEDWLVWLGNVGIAMLGFYLLVAGIGMLERT